MLTRAWQAWKRIAHALGTFQARLLLTIFLAQGGSKYLLMQPIVIRSAAFSQVAISERAMPCQADF